MRKNSEEFSMDLAKTVLMVKQSDTPAPATPQEPGIINRSLVGGGIGAGLGMLVGEVARRAAYRNKKERPSALQTALLSGLSGGLFGAGLGAASTPAGISPDAKEVPNPLTWDETLQAIGDYPSTTRTGYVGLDLQNSVLGNIPQTLTLGSLGAGGSALLSAAKTYPRQIFADVRAANPRKHILGLLADASDASKNTVMSRARAFFTGAAPNPATASTNLSWTDPSIQRFYTDLVGTTRKLPKLLAEGVDAQVNRLVASLPSLPDKATPEQKLQRAREIDRIRRTTEARHARLERVMQQRLAGNSRSSRAIAPRFSDRLPSGRVAGRSALAGAGLGFLLDMLGKRYGSN